ncbi:LysR substrate-binding domain-containing protein [Algoriphagus sediminis]|uniref:LysR substrate-binding domain-containing protein n=1 Tax=Algoriphagus sediminis TaxID=3057113 RepID=A0ABT7Y967_9BACT|nr:LysR substrate-binding domain-containing protein [Algoriphagus sediminis]MDN3203052.1 LysR substrate-binding domain-containing protein [Algoriphagus sediminis]
MNISFQQLRALQLVAEHNSITKAAKSIGMTQPAISIQLKNLQEQFEVPLTEVVGKKIFMTEFGQQLVETADKIFKELNQVEQKMLDLKGLLAGKISISAVSTGKYIIPYLISDFMKLHPHVEISLEVSNRRTVFSHLQKNSTDLAIVSVLPDDFDFEKVTLAKNRWQLACSPENAEFYQEQIDNNQWQNVPFVLRESGSGTRVMMEKFFNHRNISVKSKMEFATNEAVKQALMAGLGASVLSNFSIYQEKEEGRIVTLDYPGLPIVGTWDLVWLKQKKHSPAVLAFIRWISENKERLFEKHFPEA